MNKTNLVLDYEKLFRFSGLVDSLRDSLKYSLRNSKNIETNTESSIRHYNVLLEKIKKCIDPDITNEFEEIFTLLKDGTTVDEVFIFSSQLSKYLDTLHQTPEFLLGLKVREINAEQVNSQIAESKSSRWNEGNVLHFGMSN